jgi:NAD(P)-dependent dehydrogenase (short-subunit alcohol dehydrogenase family)
MKSNTIFSLKNKVVVITGAAGLMGRQHAHAIASFGGIPIIIDIHKKSNDEFVKQLNLQYKINTTGYVVDITNEQAVKKNCDQILKKYQKIDALINNAANNPKVENNSITNLSRLENYPLEQWNNDIAVGLTGAYICAKYYGSAINANPKGGVILNISSDLGLISPDQRLYKLEGLEDHQQPVKPVSYSVIKSGLIGLTKYLATYWPGKVRCNAICPGGIEAGQAESFVKHITSLIPLGRMAKVDDYQGAIVFILSDASSYMNGAIIPIEGGRSTW